MKLLIKDTSGNTYECDVASDTTIGNLAMDFFEAMGWAAQDQLGQGQRAVVEFITPSGAYTRLSPDARISELDIQEKSILSIYPESIAGCFTGNTLVILSSGESLPISQIKIQDKLLSGAINSSLKVPTIVTDIYVSKSDEIKEINGKLNVTDSHYVCCNSTWKRAAEINIGDKLQGFNNQPIIVESTRHLKGDYKIYNLHVESDEHTFFAEDILVHNMQAKTFGLSKNDDMSSQNKIENLERRLKQVEIKLDKIAESFGHLGNYFTKIRFIKHNEHYESESSSQNANRIYTILNIDEEFSDFDIHGQNKLIFALADKINILEHEIKIVDIQTGSIVVTLEMPEDAALRLMELWLKQHVMIATLNISKVELKPLTLNSSSKMLPIPSYNNIKLLFLASNPTNTSQLRLGEEIRAIEHSLRLSEFRDKFKIIQCWATRVSDIQSDLLRHTPHIVHFSGHGTEKGELIFENEVGESSSVPVNTLTNLFSTLKDNIRCVLLNSCYSAEQANAIAMEIDCVIGMSNSITDKSAISFATSFYQALGYGRNITTAFNLGCSQIDLDNSKDYDIPKLIAIKSDPSSIMFI
jgi:hypothetical protein